MKRRSERGNGAVDSSNRQWQDNCSKDMSWFKLDIPQMGQSSTLVPESSLLPGLTPKNVSISIPAPSWKTGLKALVWYVYLLQWHGVEIRLRERYSIVSFRRKVSSHGKGRSGVVLLPPSAIVFLFRILGEWVFFNHIFSFHMRL